jgi:hypothetical protein
LVGAASAATLCAIESARFEACRGVFGRDPLHHRKREVRGESPSYRKSASLVGAASAATLCVIEGRGSGLMGASSSATLAPSKAEVRG